MNPIMIIMNAISYWLMELLVAGFVTVFTVFFTIVWPAMVYTFLFVTWYLMQSVLCFLSLPWFIADAYRYVTTPPSTPRPVPHQPPSPTIYFPLPSEPLASPLWPVPSHEVHWSPPPTPVTRPFDLEAWLYEGYLLDVFEANLLNRGPLARMSRPVPAPAPAPTPVQTPVFAPVFAAPVFAAPVFAAPVFVGPVSVAPRTPVQNNFVVAPVAPVAAAPEQPLVDISPADALRQGLRAAGQHIRTALVAITSAKTDDKVLYEQRVAFDKVLRPHLEILRRLSEATNDKQGLRASIEWPLDDFKPVYNDIEDEELDAPIPDDIKQLMLLMEKVYEAVGLNF